MAKPTSKSLLLATGNGLILNHPVGNECENDYVLRSVRFSIISTLSRLARRGRPALLDDLAALTPWIVAYTERSSQPTVLKELVRAIAETAHCWP